MENKIATVVWNEFIAQTANNGINFSFTDLEKRIKETIDEADNLIAFMSLTEDDRQMAEYICKLHNDNINKNS